MPSTEEELRALPGIGAYTAAAVACFAFGRPTVVVDTNVRRVLARTLLGEAQAAPAMTGPSVTSRSPRCPTDRGDAVVWNVAVMELGALVCTARSPALRRVPGRRPVRLEPGRATGVRPDPLRRGQAWDGTDRQVRGALLGVLRAATAPVSGADLRDGLARRPTADALPRLARRRRAGRAAGRRPLPAAGLNRPVARTPD